MFDLMDSMFHERIENFFPFVEVFKMLEIEYFYQRVK